MIPYWSLDGSQLYQGNVLDVLQALADQSVHMVATSPPYYGLRSYGLPPVEWPLVSYAPMAGLPPIEIAGCDPGCKHEWGEEILSPQRETRDAIALSQKSGLRKDGRSEDARIAQLEQSKHNDASARGNTQGQFCQLCGGWRGSLGLEPTVEAFVGHIVLIWRELWRVLRDDGTCWVNFGDSYASSGAGTLGRNEGSNPGSTNLARVGKDNQIYKQVSGTHKRKTNLKPKDLIGIPWRVAFALQADGWYLRSDIIWAKGLSFCLTYSGSCMPESVTDRPTKGHEYVFLLSKQARYFYDGDAVREQTGSEMTPEEYARKTAPGATWPSGGITKNAGSHKKDGGQSHPAGRNLRTVWAINPGSYAGAHFATFPSALVEPMIKAGTSERGACSSCGAPWERVTEKAKRPSVHKSAVGEQKDFTGSGVHRAIGQQYTKWLNEHPDVTTGWRPTCTCEAGDPVPCTVLDPFGGSGTTADVSRQLGRRWILIELSKSYCDDHIIPRLTEPLLEWAEQRESQELEPIQMELL